MNTNFINQIREINWNEIELETILRLPVSVVLFIMIVISLSSTALIQYIHLNKFSSKVSKIEKNISKSIDEFDLMTNINSDKPIIKAELKHIINRIEEQKSNIPSEVNFTLLNQKLTQSAEQSDLIITNFKLEDEVELNNFITQPFKIKARGDYYNLTSFFYELVNVDQAITIDAVSIDLIDDDTFNNNQLSIDISLSAYKK
ncbi:type 4a pilus biogenesis protein PilO [Photobacterium leiognathi]|uniref:type 4a pilus biogenesis protein PilO n=1 Tax=Photobacterium leiognathi TaxID=553611 RepID=UPI0029816EC4|nr:type 4a pilus biogenesis protein PilO [Photobacterium leiognathi]